jgi:hypothetical protein
MLRKALSLHLNHRDDSDDNRRIVMHVLLDDHWALMFNNPRWAYGLVVHRRMFRWGGDADAGVFDTATNATRVGFSEEAEGSKSANR